MPPLLGRKTESVHGLAKTDWQWRYLELTDLIMVL